MADRRETLLIVEDDPYDAKLIKRAIKKARILNPVQVVEDGEQAIAYLAGHPPYDDRSQFPLPVLMLLDLKLPRKDGFEVLQWLRSQAALGRLPVVMLTSSSQTYDINRAYDLGANSYLVKPVGTDSLVDMLKTVELYWLIASTNPELEEGADAGCEQ
ncbi:MAG: response regulator [Planctomycetes bacterium]|nr:response regulator [Planctomycetota bacterium]MBL7044420.1 response regulator [Pirellulaceae bacterium]